MRLTAEQLNLYKESGYLLVTGLFDSGTAERMIEHYMAMRAEGPKPGDSGGTPDEPEDPTHKYPRMINMHRWDEVTENWARHANLLNIANQLIDDTPVLRQTMLYFKPPGGRGQGLHQDQQYITTDPLIGVWIALDESDKSVGQMIVVPGSHKLGHLTVQAADTSVSFTPVQSEMPAKASKVGVNMRPGDGLFFDGKTLHGSYLNTTTDRWRRSFICHYVGEHAVDFVPEQGTHVSHLRSS
ncbi:MAG: phytanoyl-CoA dioxygenase family protein [Candidatus Poribacteria bacterium]|nr:phytanoyl-CoA dioxygenase family protein [Candidatus Poribacteria bacterium]MDE0505839.1 phytanoyl-CoA dioxygenase family protein [Candidatus Poribacteria bacterium]